MVRKAFMKKLKSVIALSAVATLMITSAIPVGALSNKEASAVATSTNKKLRNVMYYGDWSIWTGESQFYPKDIPAENLTHLNLAFMDFTKTGELAFCDKDANTGHPLGNAGVTYGDINGGIINEFQVLRQRNPNLKIGISLGGWSKSNNFTWVARDASTRAKFIQNVMDFIRYANMDFVDIDWEYPGEVRDPDKNDSSNDMGTPDSIPADKENYIKLLEDFRVALDKQGKELNKTYELSAALPMSHSKTALGINVKRMFELLDFGNIMTYDAAGAWDDVSGHHAALYDNPNSPYAGKGFSVDSSITNYLKEGAPAEKLVIGAAYYTRGWEKVSNDVPDKNLPGLYGKATAINKNADGKLSYGALNYAPIKPGDGGTASGVWGWRTQSELKAKYSGLKEYWDDTAKAPYLYNESSGAFFTYDNVRSIQEKAKYVKEKNLGGMIAWMASQDKPTTSTKRDELTKATKEALFGTAALPTYDIVEPAVGAKMEVSSSKPAWGDGGSLSITLTNTGTLKTSGETLTLTETGAKTLKHTKLYIKTNGVKITGGEYPAPAVKEENGYYVLSFDGSDQKLIKLGASLKFSLTTDKVLDGTKGIVSIEMTQRMYEGAPEFSRVTLFTGEDTVYEPEDINKDGKIDILDLTAISGKYNLKTGQTGFDVKCDLNKDGVIDIFDLVKVAKRVGETNGGGETEGDTWDIKTAYTQGSIVIYKGVKYRAKYYSQGEEPGQPWNAWEKIS